MHSLRYTHARTRTRTGLHTNGGFNYPLRGQKDTLWEGGIKAVGFIHSALLPPSAVGGVYRGLVHVSDWFPTILHLTGAADAGDMLSELEVELELDGFNVWDAITTNSTSPRAELLHNIDILEQQGMQHTGTATPSGFGRAAIRVGDYKLIVGEASDAQQAETHYVAPGCSLARCPTLSPSKKPGCTPDDSSSSTWLFNIATDPYELCNLAGAMPEQVAAMLGRLAFYNRSAVPPLNAGIKEDPAADPKNRVGPFTPNGCWGPWRSSSNATD